jgi:muramoyltetrapeptide carboxypeptidase
VDPERLGRGRAELESLGFRVRVPEGATERLRFTAGSVERRVAELHSLLSDDDVAGIVCARGGAGAGSLLGRLDGRLATEHPKVFLGYSDATFLHLWLGSLGLVTFHGPMAARELADGDYDRDSLLRAVSGDGEPYATDPDDLLCLRPGGARGRLLGGCLSILAAAAGTPWALRPRGEPVVLFVEDTREHPFRLDRMLRQLRDSGGFDGVVGVVLGDMKGCAPPLGSDYGLEEVVLDALGGLDVPIAMGLSSGHASGPAVTLPFGVRVRLVCGAETRLEVLEPAVE